MSIDAGQTDALLVHVEHDSNGLAFAVIEDSLQDEDDEFHCGEIVIMQKDLVERRPLQPCLTLGLLDDRALMVKLFNRHTATFNPMRQRSTKSSQDFC